ncbi:MAG: hypothetical protein J7577_22900 [Sphingobacteriaceae bacterium]|nr:hypothetical protein [Sphingobacteriaceae bacterium]
MATKSNIQEKSKNLPVKEGKRSDIYTSNNSLSQRGEVKSVSEAMHKYIKEGFEKIAATKKKN